jgi:hypothetical protein
MGAFCTPLGTMMMVFSFVPSRIGIITVCFT